MSKNDPINAPAPGIRAMTIPAPLRGRAVRRMAGAKPVVAVGAVATGLRATANDC